MATGLQSNSDEICGEGHSKYLENKINYGYNLVKGLRHKMEDFHVAEFRKVNSHELGFFAIYDGHSGMIITIPNSIAIDVGIITIAIVVGTTIAIAISIPIPIPISIVIAIIVIIIIIIIIILPN